MALTDYQAESLLTQAPFLQRVALNLGIICQNIISEAPATALHAQRVRLASQIVTGTGAVPANAPIVVEFAAQVLTQLNLATTSLVTANGIVNGDVDTTDSAIATILSSIYNDFITQ